SAVAQAGSAVAQAGSAAAQAGSADARPGSGDGIVISVRDTGLGMTADVVAHASEPFFTTKPRGKGTGLGLASAHDLARQSGGALRILSAVGIGTTIEMSLPRAVIDPCEPELPRDVELAALGGDATILLVDDDESVRALTAHLLRDLGYAVIEAKSAETAIALAHITERLDLVMTDIVMPGDSGPNLAARLRLDRPTLPVLFISGFGGDELGQDARTTADRAFLRKPFNRAALARAVLERLGRLPSPGAGQGVAVAGSARDKVRDRLRSPDLRNAYDRWKSARSARNGLPPPDVLAEDGHAGPNPGIADHGFMVEVIEAPGGGRTGEFRYVRFGDALAERLGRSLVGELVGDEGEELGSSGVSYRRCLETASPSYEYARYALGDDTPLLFERLLLPVSEDGARVTHILGIALFTELGTPS
ncbi:response regulator, partial [Skermanella stibiiresistens]|uniref:response regulator n=1 Tax=Skermanella stibiiresistens TaxID=913326 RepID=UPI0012FB2A97